MISFEFVAENIDELEADFQREYGIDLRDALFGENAIGVRRLSALINGLPADSATMRKVTSGGQQWGQVEELLATLCELVDLTNRMLYAANFDTKKEAVWDPIKIPRPYGQEVTIVKKKATTAETLSFLGTMAASDGNVFVDNPEHAVISSTPEENTTE